MKSSLLLSVLVLSALMLSVENAQARGRPRGRSSGSRSSAAAAARKQQMIAALQQQLSAARQVLSTAESQANMSSSQVNDAVGKITNLRKTLETAQDEVKEAARVQQETEEEILEGQGANSQLKKDQAALEKAKQELHEAIQNVLKLPEKPHKSGAGGLTELASLSEADRAKVEADPGYKIAKWKMTDAAREVETTRKQLFEKSSDWIAARDNLRDARKRADASRKEANSVAAKSAGERKELRNSQDVVAAARAVVAEAEARLSQLGVKQPSGTKRTK